MNPGRAAATLAVSFVAPGAAQAHQGRVLRGIVIGAAAGLWGVFGMLLWGHFAIPHLLRFVPETSHSLPWPYKVPNWIYLVLCLFGGIDALHPDTTQAEGPSTGNPLVRCLIFAAGYWVVLLLLHSGVVASVYWLASKPGH